MYTCVLDQEGKVLLHRDLPTVPDVFLKAIAPFRESLVVAVECIFTWYWLADPYAREGIDFVLGPALYMKAIHGGKAKNDRIDALKIATLLRGGMLPQSYVYPPVLRLWRYRALFSMIVSLRNYQLRSRTAPCARTYPIHPLDRRRRCPIGNSACRHLPRFPSALHPGCGPRGPHNR